MIFEKILDILFPKCCGICGKLGNTVCRECVEKLEKYRNNNTKNNQIEVLESTVNMHFLYKYEGLVRKILLKYKFDDQSYLFFTLIFLVLNSPETCIFIGDYDIMMPVPLHKKRHLERGYNQTELVAKNLGEKLKICVNGKILIKNKNIKPQSQKTGEDRFKDVVGIYDLNSKYVQDIVGKKVLIFDDIYTTGSTCKECAKMLLKGGAKEVGIFCFARDHLRCETYKSQKDR